MRLISNSCTRWIRRRERWYRSCLRRSSRVPQILTRRRQSALGFLDCRLGSWKWSSPHTRISVERKYDEYNEDLQPYALPLSYKYAARKDHLDCLKYLHETAKVPWDDSAVREAHKRNQPECLQYLLDNNCPLPDGWRYERGELYSESESESESE